jgi:hypothetical protein
LIASETVMALPWGCNFPIGHCFSVVNSGLHALGTGAYHCGVEVSHSIACHVLFIMHKQYLPYTPVNLHLYCVLGKQSNFFGMPDLLVIYLFIWDSYDMIGEWGRICVWSQ